MIKYVEGVVQNRLNIANGDIDESQVIDDENENKSKCVCSFTDQC